MKNLTFSFDIGYASIGWAVISAEKEHPEQPLVEGTGVVLFEPNSALASKRREFRRMRRTIRARRKRIDRIGAILQQSGIITEEERKQPGHPAPFLLAARALQGKTRLSGKQIWDLMRWYAHNRGYNGNSPWARSEEKRKDDTEKLVEAQKRMEECRTSSMAETVTQLLGLSAEDEASKFSCQSPAYKQMGMAFPREVVENEVKCLLYHHADIPAEVADLIVKEAAPQKEKLAEYGVRFPLRYIGSVLFGQLKPRFDNRIIARCPITWAAEYGKSLAAGLDEAKAKQHADKMAKVPKADCSDFYHYRFARILANLRVNGNPISAETRQTLMEQALRTGHYTANQFIKVFETIEQTKEHNLRNYFQITPDAENALDIVPKKDKRASGRAPYARPVLRQVVEEVLRGEDPTRPAYSRNHLNGEKKAADGVLYALSDPESDVSRIQAARSIDEQTNNHMVRHRMLIFERLLADMVKKYAENDSSRVTQCCIEVARELKEFSGMDSEQIKKALNAKLSSYHSAVKRLEKEREALGGRPISGRLIRKCRIAMDMDFTCPYTGYIYKVKDLPHLELEHIVPRAARKTDALAALVLTWPEINRMKDKRTAREFIREFQTQQVEVEGRENLSIMTEERFKAFVNKLSTKGVPDDQKRCSARRRLLLVEKTPQQGDSEGLGFTEGQLTQSSQLMRLASQVAKKKIKGATISMIPGYVTAETRKCWNTLGTLVSACPEVVDKESGRLLDKESIRNITHLHHAVDAATLGLVLHLIPAGDNGVVWQAIGRRRLDEKLLYSLRKSKAINSFHVDSERRIHLKDIPQEVYESLAERLCECRVIRHIPADMSGAQMQEQLRRVIKVDGPLVTLMDHDGKPMPKPKNISQVIGLHPTSKLRKNKAALLASYNYGAVLEPYPEIIPSFNVYSTIKNKIKENGGRPVHILRKGQLIRINRYKDNKRIGVWRVVEIAAHSPQGGVDLSLQRPFACGNVKITRDGINWRGAQLKELLKFDVEIILPSYVGE